MSDDPRATAVARLRQLHESLQHAEPDLSSYVEQTEQLIVAVEASHMEGIRFRLFGLRRQCAANAETLPESVIGLLDDVAAALRQAGFKV